MNSAQRRKKNREWVRENIEEIKKVIAWIKSPDVFVPDGLWKKDCIEMGVEKIRAFGGDFKFPKKFWEKYLIRRGVTL